MQNDIPVVDTAESIERKVIDTSRRESEADEIEQEEIMQFVWAYKILRLLLYGALIVGRGQFRAYGSGHDVAQSSRKLRFGT